MRKAPELLLYLDQNYLSGIVKRKHAFRELEPVLRAAVARGAIAVPESEAHQLESAARPDLPLLELLRELSAGLTLPRERTPLRASASGVSRQSSNATFPSAGVGRATVSTFVHSQLLFPTAVSSRATPSWPTSSAELVSTCASAASFSPAAARTWSGFADGSNVSRPWSDELRAALACRSTARARMRTRCFLRRSTGQSVRRSRGPVRDSVVPGRSGL